MIRSLLIALSLLGLAACSKPATEDAAGSAPAAATDAAASAAPSGTATVDAAAAGLVEASPPLDLGEFKIVGLLMGKAVDGEHLVLQDTREFAAKDSIYASVLSIGAHQGLKLSAEWIAPDGSSIAKREEPIVPSTDLATTFNISNPTGWPAGDYELRVAINGQTQLTEKFTVR